MALLGACATPPPQAGQGPDLLAADSPSPGTPRSLLRATPTTTEETPRAMADSPPEGGPGPACEHPRHQLADTDFGRHLALNRIPLTGEVADSFRFEIRENHFDPCAPLSHLVLNGSFGKDRSAESLILFREGRLVTQPPPMLVTEVTGVEQLDRYTLQVTHTGPSGPVTSTHRVVDGQLSTDLPRSAADPREDLPRLDLNASAPTLDPASTEIDQTLPAGRYRLPITGNQYLLCELGDPAGPLIDCYADFPTTWRLNSTLRPQANRIIYTEDPPYARGTTGPAPGSREIRRYAPVPAATILRIGTALVDLTQPNQVSIRTPGGGLLITPNSYQVLGLH